MKVYIQTDIEGIAGFCFFENRKNVNYEDVKHRHRMYKLLTAEANAAVKGAFDAGATEVVVNDSHGSGYNIIFEEMDPRCRIIHGRNCSGPHWLPLLDSSFDAIVLVGMHAMGGTPNAITPHSRWKVNGGTIFLSEASMAAAIAGDMGVPAVFASGDDKITAELRDKIPAIHVVQVKQALSVYQACTVVPSRACELIRKNVKKAVAGRKKIKPYHIKGPVTLNLIDSADHVNVKEILDKDLVAPSISQAFMDFELKMPWTKFNCSQLDGYEYP